MSSHRIRPAERPQRALDSIRSVGINTKNAGIAIERLSRTLQDSVCSAVCLPNAKHKQPMPPVIENTRPNPRYINPNLAPVARTITHIHNAVGAGARVADIIMHVMLVYTHKT